MRRLFLCLVLLCFPFAQAACAATIFAEVRGIVHDPQHRPINGATVTLHAAHSAFTRTAQTNQEGGFSLPLIPLGDYSLTVKQPGFRTIEQTITPASDTTPLLHFEYLWRAPANR